jgi:sarcosine oxidase subunit beta
MWNDWEGHLGVVDPDGMARFIRTGMCIFHTPGDGTARIERLWDEWASRTSCSTPELRTVLPGSTSARTTRRSGSTTPPSPTTPRAAHRDLEPESGFIDDPMLAARNLAYAAKPARRRVPLPPEVVSIDRTDGRVAGVTLAG